MHIAIARYVLTRQVSDVSEALERLLNDDIAVQADRSPLCETNTFRNSQCYLEAPSEELARNEPLLRAIFAGINGFEAADVSKRAESQVLSLDEWMALLKCWQVIGSDVTERDAVLCFAWSRMLVVDGWSGSGRMKEHNLPFEGFLEALCRLAALRALPDDDEIDEATLESSEVVDAASYLEFMMATDPESYDALIAERATPWGSDPAQPLDRCLAHTLSIIYRRIQLTKHGRRQSSDPQVNPQRSHLGASPAPASPSAPLAALTAAALTEADIKLWFKAHRRELVGLLKLREAL